MGTIISSAGIFLEIFVGLIVTAAGLVASTAKTVAIDAPNVTASEPMAVDANAPGASARAGLGNPLWAVSLASLSATRSRPVFTPSRRPPAPAVVAPPPPAPVAAPPPPPPPEPDRPRLALIGAVTGQTEAIAVFLDELTRSIVRLKAGQSHSGWILQSVNGREITLGKAGETVVLVLSASTDQRPGNPQLLPGLSAPGILPGIAMPPRGETASTPRGPFPAPPTGRLPGL